MDNLNRFLYSSTHSTEVDSGFVEGGAQPACTKCALKSCDHAPDHIQKLKELALFCEVDLDFCRWVQSDLVGNFIYLLWRGKDQALSWIHLHIHLHTWAVERGEGCSLCPYGVFASVVLEFGIWQIRNDRDYISLMVYHTIDQYKLKCQDYTVGVPKSTETRIGQKALLM